MRFFTISLFVLMNINVWSQEYSYQYEQRVTPEKTFILHQDSLMYFLNLTQSNNFFEYDINLAEVNKNTLKDKIIPIDKTLVSIRKGLHAFLWTQMLFFVEIDDYNQLLKISSKSINNNTAEEQTKLINIRKKDKFLTTLQINQHLYLLITSPKENGIRVYSIDMNSFELSQYTIPIHPSAFKLLLRKSDENFTIIDYSTPNSPLKMTRPVKLYQSDEIVNLTFDVREKEGYEANTHIYTIFLKDKKFKHKSIPYEAVKWNAFNAVLYKEHLYRISSQNQLIQIEIINLEKDSVILKSYDGRDYIKLNFQKSIATNELGYPIAKSNIVFDFLIKNEVCFFPEIHNGKTTLYIGGVGKLGSDSKIENENIPSNELSYSFGNTNLTTNSVKNNSVFFESSVSLDGRINNVRELSLEIYPRFRELSNIVAELAIDLGGKNISVYKMDNKLFGIFYIEYEKKFIIKSLN